MEQYRTSSQHDACIVNMLEAPGTGTVLSFITVPVPVTSTVVNRTHAWLLFSHIWQRYRFMGCSGVHRYTDLEPPGCTLSMLGACPVVPPALMTGDARFILAIVIRATIAWRAHREQVVTNGRTPGFGRARGSAWGVVLTANPGDKFDETRGSDANSDWCESPLTSMMLQQLTVHAEDNIPQSFRLLGRLLLSAYSSGAHYRYWYGM